jgi:hypothetical protein
MEKIFAFVHTRTYATRLQRFIDFTQTPDVQAINVLTQIDAMKAIRAKVREEYDYLCENAHPNALGGVLYFVDLQTERATDTVIFHAPAAA